MKKMICFVVNDWITFNKDAEYDAEEQLALQGLKDGIGDGPFQIEAAFAVAEEDVESQKHDQYLEMNDEQGKPIMKNDDEREIVSGYWFVKTGTPKRLIN
jgi:hypothetical protein